ncbi:MAG: uncharacterized protein A8A55_2170 [Amphiamblys sp. WSBS2006]|nr:MAG: uncharacterized protein A8A55_2170 [Amphiamblys sp. WSBS2006]
MDEYKKVFGPDQEEFLENPTNNPQLPDSLSLTTAALPSDVVRLTEQTLVSLEDIAIPENVFFTLLSKTKMRVRKNVSIFGNIHSDEDFLGVDEATRNKPLCLKRSGETATDLALENIRLIPQNSISCTLLSLSLKKTVFINIFPKLRISEYCEMETLTLSADKEEQVAAILAQEQPTYVRGVKKILLFRYAVNILTKIKISGDSEVKTLRLSADREEHVAAILEREQTLCVGGMRKLFLWGYAVNVLTRIKIGEENEVKTLVLSVEKKEHIAIILAQEQTIYVRGVKEMRFFKYAVNVLTKIKISKDCLLERFYIGASEEQSSKLLEAEDRSIEVGRIRKSGFDVPEEIIRKLRYTLVGEERSATSEEHESSPVEEQEPSRVENLSQPKESGLAEEPGLGRAEETPSPANKEKRSKETPSLGRKEKAAFNFSLVTIFFFWFSF